MGTLLQELGHDIVLLLFIDKVLKKRKKEVFYIVNPATGPKVDIHFWNAKQREYISAYDISPKNFIPEFELRINLDKEDIERIDRESTYKKTEWYQWLHNKLGSDIKDFVNEICQSLKQSLRGGLPDIIGITGGKSISLLAEIKFEGFGNAAKEEVSRHIGLADHFKVPYFLVIPKKPSYGKGITSSWITNNFPDPVKIYEFAFTKPGVVPKRVEIQFIELNRTRR